MIIFRNLRKDGQEAVKSDLIDQLKEYKPKNTKELVLKEILFNNINHRYIKNGIDSLLDSIGFEISSWIVTLYDLKLFYPLNDGEVIKRIIINAKRFKDIDQEFILNG
jgi:hypothetical protein